MSNKKDHGMLRGSLLVLLMVMGVSAWMNPAQAGSSDIIDADVVRFEADPPGEANPPTEADPPDPDVNRFRADPPTEADPPDPDVNRFQGDPPTEADPPDPDFVP